MWISQRETVERVLRGGLEENKDNAQYSILCDNMQKVYPGRDGNPPKKAVRGMSLAVPRGECFGMLGPNGAGKSTSISMVCPATNVLVGRFPLQALVVLAASAFGRRLFTLQRLSRPNHFTVLLGLRCQPGPQFGEFPCGPLFR